ncbi:hypothetical protein ZWY2020_039196 [Hordeum vulgare]|nr:hypothetical protein ZWY2020_039196 [Hordeum vulgare]
MIYKHRNFTTLHIRKSILKNSSGSIVKDLSTANCVHNEKASVNLLCTMQYSYWEKVQPTGIDEPLSYEYPLVLNWSELKAKKRDEYDLENGCDHGKFDDLIGEDHRQAKVAKEGTVSEVEAQSETSKRNGGSSGVINIIVIERLKKEGLVYKPAYKDINPEEYSVDESEDWARRKYTPKYFQEVDSTPFAARREEKNDASFMNMPIDDELNDDTGARMNGSGMGTPNDRFIVTGNISPVRSSSSLPTNEFPKVTQTPENGSILVLDSMHNEVSPTGSEASIDNLNESVKDGKRVHKASRWLHLFGNYVVIFSTEYLDPEHVVPANGYINTLIKHGKHRKDTVVKVPTPHAHICTVIIAYCKQIQKRSKLTDPYILSTWVSKWLLDRATGLVTGKKTKMELLVNRTTIVSRVMDEYFSTNKAYFPMNVNGNHWIIVLMHNSKKEFQVLDSLGPIDRNICKTIRTLSLQSKFVDVSAWPIMEYEMRKQTHGVSCALFVVRCVEHWDGEEWTSTFDQQEINASRSTILAKLIFS